MAKMGDRAVTLHEVLPSPGRSAAAWNAYMSSLVPYPAHYIAPSPKEERAMRKHLKEEYAKTGDKSLLTTLKSSKTPPSVMSGLALPCVLLARNSRPS